MGMLDAAGALVVKYAYDAWSNPTDETAQLSNWFNAIRSFDATYLVD